MDRGQYVRNFNDLIAAVSDGSKDEARNILRDLVNRLINTKDEEYMRRLIDDCMCAWYDTYKGHGPVLPREAAGLLPKRAVERSKPVFIPRTRHAL